MDYSYIFQGKALKHHPQDVKQLKRKKELKQWQLDDLTELKRQMELASSSIKVFDDPNDFFNLSIIGDKWALQKTKKADYYTFDIVKKDFHFIGSDYFKKTEIRDSIIREQLRKVWNCLGVEQNDYIRVISAPNFHGRLIQILIVHLLTLGIEKGWFEISDVAHGFVPQRNIKTNAIYHLERLYSLRDFDSIGDNSSSISLTESEILSYVAKRKAKVNQKFTDTKLLELNNKFSRTKLFSLNIDMKNFFPSWSKGQVIAYFTKKTNRNVGRKIANTVCKNGKLVQGSILSPLLTNLLMYQIDEELKSFTTKKGIVYSRYADDMLFSSNRKIDKSLVFQVIKILARYGLVANPNKIDFLTGIIDCNGLKIVQKNLANGGDLIRVSRKFYNKSKYLAIVHNRKLVQKLTEKLGNAPITKQGYNILTQSNLLELGGDIRSYSNLKSVALGHLSHMALAKKNVPQGTCKFLELYYHNAKTGLGLVNFNNFNKFRDKTLHRTKLSVDIR